MCMCCMCTCSSFHRFGKHEFYQLIQLRVACRRSVCAGGLVGGCVGGVGGVCVNVCSRCVCVRVLCVCVCVYV